MPPILVGSHAIKNVLPDFREPNDWDYFSPHPIEGAETFWDDRISEWTHWHYGIDPVQPTLDELYTIKISHIFWPNKWKKHASDIRFMQRAGAKLIPELYDILYPIWVDHYGAKKASLKGDKESFFDDIIERKYDHDSVHESVAYYDRPLYEKIVIPGRVAVNRDAWNELDFDDQIHMVMEEVYATALERIIIPSNYTASPRRAYADTLQRTVTSLTKGWFALFCAEHLDELWAPDVDYVQRHHDKADRLVLL
jgi:hypothetical protein